jgi:hypothetical protein
LILEAGAQVNAAGELRRLYAQDSAPVQAKVQAKVG